MAKAAIWTKADQYLANLDLCEAAAGKPVVICPVNDPDMGILVKQPDGTVVVDTSGFIEKLSADPRFPADGRVVVEDYIGKPGASVLVVGPAYSEKDAPFQPEPELPDAPKTFDEFVMVGRSMGWWK